MKIYNSPKEAIDAANNKGPGDYYFDPRPVEPATGIENDMGLSVIGVAFFVAAAIVWALPIEVCIAWLMQ